MENPSSSLPMNSVQDCNLTIACDGNEVLQDYDEGLNESDNMGNYRILNSSHLAAKYQTVRLPLSKEKNTSKTSVFPKRRPLKKRSRRNSTTVLQREQQHFLRLSKETTKYMDWHSSKAINSKRNIIRDEPSVKAGEKTVLHPVIMGKFPLPPRLTRVEARYFFTSPKHRVLFDRLRCVLRHREERDICGVGHESKKKHFCGFSTASSSAQK